jgi:signal transduction histidine kinase
MASASDAKEERSANPLVARDEDVRLLAGVRCLLVATGLAIIWFEPSEPKRLVGLTYLSLGAYLAYSLAVTLLARTRAAHRALRWLHWADVAFAGFMVALTDGTNSIFFWFFLFAALAASWLYGFREGIRVTLASTLVFTLAGLVAAPYSEAIELDRAVIRPVFLLLLGYLVAIKGGSDLRHARRLALLSEMNATFSPRRRAESFARALEGLRQDLAASDCLLVLERDSPDGSAAVHRAAGRDGSPAAAMIEVSRAVVAPLLSLQHELSSHPPLSPHRPMLARGSGGPTEANLRCAGLAELLECEALMTVPFPIANGGRGRVYVLWHARRRLHQPDLDFVWQWSIALASLTEKARLTDELMAQAAEAERRNVSRDLHDTTIQPYLGLKLAVEGLLREASHDAALAARIREVLEVTDATIDELRAYTEDIRTGRRLRGDEVKRAIESHAERLARLYGLQVSVSATGLDGVDPAIATAAHRIAVEGMNNVLRHTLSRRARVMLHAGSGVLTVDIANDRGDSLPAPFVPRSIRERAEQQRGSARVDIAADGTTHVVATLPLRAGLHVAA